MNVTWRTEWPLWVLLAAMFLVAAVTWPSAPERIPIHWGLNGEPNDYGGKFEGLLLLPLIALAIYVLLLVLPRLDPARANYAHFAGTYTIIRFTILFVLALMYAAIHLGIRGHQVALTTAMPLLVGVLFVVLGSVMRNLKPNWFIGIRTPWTLTSRRSWDKTHRVAGWVFVLLGIGVASSGLLRSSAVLIATIVVGVVGMLGTFAYSYFVWRDDPDRISLAGMLHRE